MHLQAILNHVEKQKGFVYDDIRFADDRSEILVSLRPHGRSRAVCSGCSRKRPGYDRLAERRFEFVPLWAIPVIFLYAMRRVDCPACGVRVEKVPWADGKHQSTFSYRVFLAAWAKRLNWKETEEARQMKEDGYEPILKNARWCLLKLRENLTGKQTVKLKELLQYNLRSVKAYLMREDFQRFWMYSSPAWAGKFLDQWCTRAMRSKIGPMQDMAKTLRSHRELLLNWFRERGEVSNGSVEGMNIKAKLAMRKAYGFKSYETIEIALYHQLGRLPEPDQTHRFC